jgi:hypothetical protein
LNFLLSLWQQPNNFKKFRFDEICKSRQNETFWICWAVVTGTFLWSSKNNFFKWKIAKKSIRNISKKTKLLAHSEGKNIYHNSINLGLKVCEILLKNKLQMISSSQQVLTMGHIS